MFYFFLKIRSKNKVRFAKVFRITFFVILLINSLFNVTKILAQDIYNPDLKETSTLNIDKDVNSSYRVADYLYLYEDKTNLVTIDDLINSKVDLFQKNKSVYPTFGFSKSAHWGKFTWKGTGKKDKWYLLFDYTMLDRIELFIVNPVNKKYIKKTGGNFIPLSMKDVNHRKTIFHLNPPGNNGSPDAEQTIYFKVNSEDTVEIPLMLLDQDALREMDYRYSFAQGLYYGIMLVMFVYNFFLFMSIRDPAYLNYTAYILTYGIVQYGLDGFLYQYIFPENNEYAKITRMVCANLAMMLALRFADSFFNIKANFPKLKGLLPLFYGATFINLILVFFNFFISAQIVFILLLSSVLIFLFFSISLFNKYPPVRLYFLAWFIFIMATFLWSLKLFDIYLPEITPYSMQMGTVIEVTLLSFALGSRIRLINREKEEIKNEAIKQQQMLEKGRVQLALLRNKTSVIEKELSLARDIQLAMLPLKSMYDNIQSIYLPMEKIGGDFYDIIVLNDRKVGIFISDVSGHGVPAALITVMLKSIILIGVSELHRNPETSWLMEPDKFIAHMNNSLHGHLRDNFTTAFYGVFDKVDRTFKYSSAAHPPPILMDYQDNDQLNFNFINVSPQAPPFGVFWHDPNQTNIAVNQVIVNKNSRLIMYSDGLMDNFGYGFMNSHKGLESFKDTILYEIFLNSKKLNLQHFLELISIRLLMHREMGLEDDVCVVVLEA